MPTAAIRRVVSPKRAHQSNLAGKRFRGSPDERTPFVPPEDWHEPTGRQTVQYVVQPPGVGYRHVVTPAEVADRLAKLPPGFVKPLEVVQFSQVTRKKKSMPCYGMQWGNAVYLYPIEDDLVEHYPRPPKPAQIVEARMFGGRFRQDGPDDWKLVWTERAVKDFYLNNVLVHEVGHLLDERNSSYADREKYAEWFAVHFGYRPTNPERRPVKKVVRRHHRK